MLLFEARPELEQEWDFEKNSGMDPYKLSYGYYKMVHWKCQHGHTWEASISTRANGGGNCPACPGKRQQFVSGINDLATLYPDLMEEWDWEENAGLDPTQISPGCNKTVKWKCKKYGHSWSTTITTRTKMKCGCPYCANQKVLSGFNDLVTDLSSQDTRHFFSQHHLNGCRKSTNCVTLVDENNDIISALSFTIGKRSARIVQYASTRYIPEGFTTLLRAVVDYCSTIPSCTKLVATSDNDWPYDHILSSASFRKDKMTPPKQKFFAGTKYDTRLDSPDDHDGKIAILWNCGTTKWVYNLHDSA